MRRSRVWISTIAVAIVVFAGSWEMHNLDETHAATPSQPLQVPVVTTTARLQNVPVFLDGLGTVQAFNTVEIKAQVTGILLELPAHEGQEVRKGDIVAKIDPAPFKAALDEAVAQRSEDEAQLHSAQLDLARFQTLAARSYAPIQQVDDQQATVNKEIATIAADEAKIETAQIDLGYCVIRAPFDGRVSLYQLDVGNLVQADSATGIISITQDKPIAVVLTLPEDQLPQVQDARAKGPVMVEAYDSQGQKLLARGSLLTPNNSIDTATGTISLKAEFSNADDHLWPGQFINARVQVDTLGKAITLPSLSIEHGPNGLFVYLVSSNGMVAQTAVQIGYQDNGSSVVTKGLSSGDVVVLTGQSRLSPGAHVKATNGSKAAQPPTAEAPLSAASPS
jgi:membrane fusion protein, multidrug efflux system